MCAPGGGNGGGFHRLAEETVRIVNEKTAAAGVSRRKPPGRGATILTSSVGDGSVAASEPKKLLGY